MRMFLVVMCDIFLMLYLTAMIDVTPKTALTVDDFFELSSMHATLEQEKERLLEEKRRQEELAHAKRTAERARLEELERSLALSDSERERIEKDLMVNKEILKSREQLLEKLNKEIAAKGEEQRKMQAAFQRELEDQSKLAEESRKMVEEAKAEANNAGRLAEQMKEQAQVAFKTAETANTVRVKALEIKEQAIKDKEDAERKVQEALAALKKAEAEKQKTFQDLQEVQMKKKVAVKYAKRLANTIQDIKQDGETAYKNIHPQLQTVNIIFERKSGNRYLDYRRELAVLPVDIDNETYVIFPSKQAGFSGADTPPDRIKIWYNDKLIKNGRISTEDDLIALTLPEFDGKAEAPYPPDTKVDDLMPALLAVRNKGNIAMSDKVLGVSEDYFIVNRDLLEPVENRYLEFTATGWRGTGSFAERIVLGDQLLDLNGRLIGVANEADRVVRIGTVKDWVEITF